MFRTREKQNKKTEKDNPVHFGSVLLLFHDTVRMRLFTNEVCGIHGVTSIQRNAAVSRVEG